VHNKNENNKKGVKNNDNWQLQPNDSIYNCKKKNCKNVVKNPRCLVVLVVAAVVKCAKCQRQQRRHNTVFCIFFAILLYFFAFFMRMLNSAVRECVV